MENSDTVTRYATLLRDRVSCTPVEFFEILGLTASDSPSDFIQAMYVPLTFSELDGSEASAHKDIFEILDSHFAVTILGEAGTGKTTSLKFVARELCDSLEKYCIEDSRFQIRTVESAQAELRENQQKIDMIKRRMSEFILSIEIPLQLVKEKDELEKQQEAITAFLANNTKNLRDSTTEGKLLIPVFIQLGGLTEYLAKLNSDVLKFNDLLKHIISEEYDILPRLFEILVDHLGRGELCILLDGLDELNSDSRQKVIEMLSRLKKLYRPRLVLTSRPHAFPDGSLPDFTLFSIDEFRGSQIDDYLVRWYSDVYKKIGTVSESRLYAWTLYNKIKASGVIDMSQSPLILTQLVILHRTTEDMASANHKVIHEVLRLLLFKWRMGLSVSYQEFECLRQRFRLSDDDLLLTVGAIAYCLLEARAENKETKKSKRQILEWIHDYIQEMGIDNERVAEVIFDYLLNCYGILTSGRAEDKGYSFVNPIMQEYLAAYYLLNVKNHLKNYMERLPRLLAQGIPLWENVTLFVFELLEENASLMFANHLMQKLHGGKSDNDLPRELLCARIVDKLVKRKHSFEHYPSLLDNVKKSMKRIVESRDVDWSAAVVAGFILGRLGDDRSCMESMLETRYWIEIPGGSFRMGRGLEKHEVGVQRYYIARFPVTNEQFVRFVEETQYKRVPENWYTDEPFLTRKNCPVIGVHWKEAIDFAQWFGEKLRSTCPHLVDSNWEVRLPTESEWERASCDFKQISGLATAVRVGTGSSTNSLAPSDVEVWPIGIACVQDPHCQIKDLFSHVWEWTSSAYKPYPYNADDGRNDVTQNEPRVVRGGYAHIENGEFLKTHRGQCHMYRPVYKMNNVGFRLVIGEKLR